MRCVLWGSLRLFRAAPPAWVAALRVCMALRVHAGRLSGCWGAQHARVRLQAAVA